MAILYASRGRDAYPAITVDRAGQVSAVTSIYDVADGIPASGDVVRFLQIPENYQVIAATLDFDALATGVIDVGFEAGDTDAIFDGQATGTAATVQASLAGLTRLSAPIGGGDLWVSALIETASAATTGKIALTVHVIPIID